MVMQVDNEKGTNLQFIFLFIEELNLNLKDIGKPNKTTKV